MPLVYTYPPGYQIGYRSHVSVSWIAAILVQWDPSIIQKETDSSAKLHW
jgi:hypothetical protein